MNDVWRGGVRRERDGTFEVFCFFGFGDDG